MRTISVKDLKEKLTDDDRDEILIDVREPGEHKGERIPEAENIPLTNIDEAVDKLKGIGTVYVHCASGNRSRRACELLFEHGVNVVNVEGGISAWRAAGMEVLESGGSLPMMRQVMIVAGALIFLGLALGTWVNELWYLLLVPVGGGLLFAGITGNCWMTKVLALMPWNR